MRFQKEKNPFARETRLYKKGYFGYLKTRLVANQNKKGNRLKRFIFGVLFLIIATGLSAQITIEEGDKLQIFVIDENGTDLILRSFAPVLQSTRDPHEILVSAEGRIYIPNIGVFYVAGKTPAEVEELVRKSVPPSVQLEEISVLLVSTKVNRVYVLGEVEKPGLYQIDSTKPFEMRLMNAISLAEGFTENADLENVTVVSQSGAERTVNVNSIAANRNASANIQLKDLDTVIVGQGPGKIYVLGEVTHPGGYRHITGMDFLGYIAEAGGAKTSASLGNIGIIRQRGDKTFVVKTSMTDYTSNKAKELKLMPGDIVYLPRDFFADWKDVGEILGIARDSIFILNNFQ